MATCRVWRKRPGPRFSGSNNQGPSHIFCGVGAGGSYLYLGTGERAPDLRPQSRYSEVMSDIAGGVPIDKMYTGQSASVSVTLTRYNETVLTLIQKHTASVGVSAFRGLDNPGDIGTLMLTENCNYRLAVLHPYALKPAFTNPTNGFEPLCWVFPASFIEGPEDIMGGTTQAKKVRITWTCLRTFNLNVVNTYGNGAFTLYHHDSSGINSSLIN